MTRTVTRDGGSRYLATLPFGREIAGDELDAIRDALASAAFDDRGTYGTEPLDTLDIDVSADEARVTVALPIDDEHDPADVLARLSRTLGEYHEREGPLTEPTRAGGQQSLATLDASALGVDRDPSPGETHTYLLAYPDRPLTDEEVAVLEHVTDDDALVTSAFVALFDAIAPVYDRPADRALRQLRTDLTEYLPAENVLREHDGFPTREIGTVAAVNAATRQAVSQRALRESPHATVDEEVAAES